MTEHGWLTDEQEKENQSLEREGRDRQRDNEEARLEDRAVLFPELGLHVVFVASLTYYLLKPGRKLAGMGDPATLVESAASPVVTAMPTVIAGEIQGEESVCSRAIDQRAEKDKAAWEVIVWESFCCRVKGRVLN